MAYAEVYRSTIGTWWTKERLRCCQYWSKGPNYIYHIDGWNKLKCYGLCVHRCTDGFSRRIIWLESGPTNNDPFIVCHYFADCVKNLNGLPHIIRSDRETENVNVEYMQRETKTMTFVLFTTQLFCMVHHHQISILKHGGAIFREWLCKIGLIILKKEIAGIFTPLKFSIFSVYIFAISNFSAMNSIWLECIGIPIILDNRVQLCLLGENQTSCIIFHMHIVLTHI